MSIVFNIVKSVKCWQQLHALFNRLLLVIQGLMFSKKIAQVAKSAFKDNTDMILNFDPKL